MTPSPHDALFKAAFSSPEHAAPELRALLPAAVTARIDWATLALAPGSFIDEQLRSSRSDLLFSAQLAGREALLYVLFEHQSSVDGWMPLRLLAYMVRIWEQCLDEEPARKRLPPIVPLVLHHDPGGWTAATSMHAIVDPIASELPELGRLVPQFSFLLDDLAEENDEALRGRALGAFPRLVLWALRDARSPGRLVASLGTWLGAMVELLQQPQGAEAFRTLMRYIFQVTEEGSFDQVRQAMLSLPAPAQETVMTIAEWLENKGRIQGRDEGRDEGRRAGELHEARKALRRVLGKRGLALSSEQEAAIDTCSDLGRLERWLDGAIGAASAQEALQDA